MSIFRGCFSCIEDVIGEFCITLDDLQGMEIVYAEYERSGYEGDAFILLRKGCGLVRGSSKPLQL